MTSEHPSVETIIDYIHHELSPTDDAAIFEHFAQCPPCRAEYEAELRLGDALTSAAAAETLELPSMVKARIWEQARSERPGRWAALVQPLIALPAGAAIAAAIVFALQSTPSNTRTPMVGAQYYFDVHSAATRQENPLSDRSVPLTIDAAVTVDGLGR